MCVCIVNLQSRSRKTRRTIPCVNMPDVSATKEPDGLDAFPQTTQTHTQPRAPHLRRHQPPLDARASQRTLPAPLSPSTSSRSKAEGGQALFFFFLSCGGMYGHGGGLGGSMHACTLSATCVYTRYTHAHTNTYIHSKARAGLTIPTRRPTVAMYWRRRRGWGRRPRWRSLRVRNMLCAIYFCLSEDAIM